MLEGGPVPESGQQLVGGRISPLVQEGNADCAWIVRDETIIVLGTQYTECC